MPLVLAIEPDPRQASRLEHLMRTRVGAELIRADTTEHALAAIGTRVPDLVLVPSLLSPQEDAALAGALRVIAAAARVQMLTIPLLADPEQPPEARRGLLGRWRRGAARQTAGCDPALFAEQVAAYLAHARSSCLDGADEGRELDAPAPSEAPHAAVATAGDEPAWRDVPEADVAAAAAGGLDDVPMTSASPSDEPIVSIEPRRLVAPAAFVKHVHETEIPTTPEEHNIDRDEARSRAERAVVASAVNVLASSHEGSEQARDAWDAIAATDDIAQRAGDEDAAAECVAATTPSLVTSQDRVGHETRREHTESCPGPAVDADQGLAHHVPATTPGARELLLFTHDAALQSAAALVDRTRLPEGLHAPSAGASVDGGETASPNVDGVDLGLLVRGEDQDTGVMGTIDPAAQITPRERTEPEHLAAADLLLRGGREDQEGRNEESDQSQRGPTAAIASPAGEMSHAPMLSDIGSTAAGREHLLAHDSDLHVDAVPPDRTVFDEGIANRAAQSSGAAQTGGSRQGEHVDADAGEAGLVVRADRDGRDAGETHHEEIGGAEDRQLASGGGRQQDVGLPPREGSAGDEIDASTVDALIAPLLRELMASRHSRTEARATERAARGPESGELREKPDARPHDSDHLHDSDHDGSATPHVASSTEGQTTAQGQIQSEDLAAGSNRDRNHVSEAAYEHMQAHSDGHARAEERACEDARERAAQPPLEPVRDGAQPRTHAGAPEHEGLGRPVPAPTSAATEVGRDAEAPAAERSRARARAEGEGGVSSRPAPPQEGDYESAGWQQRELGAEQDAKAEPDIVNVEALSSAQSAVAFPDEIDPMFFVDDDSPEGGSPASAAASVHAAASRPPALEAPDAAAASPGRSAAGAPAAAREPWVELIESLRQDIERLRLEREAAAGAPAARPRPTSRFVTSFDEAKSRVRPRITTPQLRMPDQGRPAARPTKKRPVQDQWGLFDPEQCGFAALLAKLDEISARDEASA